MAAVAPMQGTLSDGRFTLDSRAGATGPGRNVRADAGIPRASDGFTLGSIFNSSPSPRDTQSGRGFDHCVGRRAASDSNWLLGGPHLGQADSPLVHAYRGGGGLRVGAYGGVRTTFVDGHYALNSGQPSCPVRCETTRRSVDFLMCDDSRVSFGDDTTSAAGALLRGPSGRGADGAPQLRLTGDGTPDLELGWPCGTGSVGSGVRTDRRRTVESLPNAAEVVAGRRGSG